MNKKNFSHTSRVTGSLLPLLAAAFPLAPGDLIGATSSWTAGGVGTNWSVAGNWDLLPDGNDIIFGESGKTVATQTGNRVDQNKTIGSLSFVQTGAGASDYQVMEISSGVTLTINGSTFFSGSGTALNVGQLSANPTNTVINGAGNLVIDQTLLGKSLNIVVGAGHTAATGAASLDMRGLKSFTAKVNTFSIGQGQYSVGMVRLAENSSITASTIVIGNSLRTNLPGSGVLYLGNQTTLSATNIQIGTGKRGSGELSFDPNTVPDSQRTVMIRNVVDFIVARNPAAGDASGARQTGLADFTGGSVDAQVQNLLLGSGQGQNTGGYSIGTLKMSHGTFVSTNSTLGQSLTGVANPSIIR